MFSNDRLLAQILLLALLGACLWVLAYDSFVLGRGTGVCELAGNAHVDPSFEW